ncbi:hypothetical protein ALT716_100120 [Alteromonas macleodii]
MMFGLKHHSNLKYLSFIDQPMKALNSPIKAFIILEHFKHLALWFYHPHFLIR